MLTPRQPRRQGIAGRAAPFGALIRRFPIVPLIAIWAIFMTIGLVHYTNTSSYFLVDEVRIEGHERLQKAALLRFLEEQCGVGPGVNLVATSAAEIEKALKEIPEVAHARAIRAWPNEVHIMLQERQPAGIFVSPKGSFVFDGQGLLFARASAADLRDPQLPVVTGFENAGMETGRRLPREALAKTLNYLETFAAAAPELAARISEYHWDTAAGLTLVLNDGARFRCGTRPPQETGPVVEALLERQPSGRRIDTANLITSRHAAVQWREANTEPPASQLARKN